MNKRSAYLPITIPWNVSCGKNIRFPNVGSEQEHVIINYGHISTSFSLRMRQCPSEFCHNSVSVEIISVGSDEKTRGGARNVSIRATSRGITTGRISFLTKLNFREGPVRACVTLIKGCTPHNTDLCLCDVLG